MTVIARKPLVLAMAAIACSPNLVSADDGLSALLLEEVLVTAQKREENIQDVPSAVTALDSRMLEAQGVTTPSDLSKFVPNMSVADYQGEVRIAIRGVGQLVQTASPGVAIHSDGVYQPRASMAGLLQLDMQGVEVLRGPQGTVYGRNANGGAVNYTSKSAGDTFGGHIKVGYAEYDETRIQAAVDVPFSDAVRARLVVDQWERGEGFVENFGSGEDGQQGDITSARLRFDADFSENLSGTFVINHLESDGTFAVLASTPHGPLATGLDPRYLVEPNTQNLGPREITQNRSSQQDREYWSYAATLDWDLNDTFSVKSITAFQTFDDSNVLDVDVSNADIVYSAYSNEADTFTQEFNVNFSTDNLSGVIGAFYMKDELTGNNNLPFDNGGFFPYSAPIPPGSYSQAYWNPLETTATALFADATYNLTERLSIIAGIRFSKEELYLEQLGGFSGPDGVLPPFVQDGRRDFFGAPTPCAFYPQEIGEVEGAAYHVYENEIDTTTPKLGANFAITDDNNVYATYSEGFKAGGISVRTGCENEFDEETVTSFEIGSKNTFADGRVRVNATAFMYEYEGFQVEQLVGLTFQLDNAEEAEVMGLELEGTFIVSDQFSIVTSASFTDSEFVDHSTTDGLTYVDNPLFGQTPPPPGPPQAPFTNLPENVSGNPLPNTPETTLNVSFNYDMDNGLGFQLGASYKSDVNYREFDRDADGQEAFTLWNANVSWSSDDDKINVRVYGNNLTDEDYITFAAANQLTDNRLVTWGAPRQVGAEVQFNF